MSVRKISFPTGPWEQEGSSYYEYDDAALCNLNLGNRVSCMLVGSMTHKVTTEELDATSALIRAARDMLEALENAPLPSTMGTAEEHYRRFYDWLNGPVKAAITKAKGESSKELSDSQGER